MTSQQPNHPHEPPTQGTQSSPVPLSTTSAHQAGERAPALAPGTRIIVFTALLLPAAVLPLLVLRRSLTSLHRKIDALATTTGGLQHELRSTLLELSVRKEQHEQLRAVLDETRASLAALRGETQRAQVVRDRIQELVVSNRCASPYVHRLEQQGSRD
ncbi:hypothetical protein BC834DRAFT_880217 [Gloeopeniophorella convolvens]|nr:hypothetical protein BC834DRAFT_880217 [Gloeopeniophorella convolvens]